MRLRLTKAERTAAVAVAAMAAAVAGAGVKLIRRHTEYLLKRAAAHFDAEQEAEGREAEAEEMTAKEEAANGRSS